MKTLAVIDVNRVLLVFSIEEIEHYDDTLISMSMSFVNGAVLIPRRRLPIDVAMWRKARKAIVSTYAGIAREYGNRGRPLRPVKTI